MGLRDRKTSRIREPGFNGYSVENSRALYRSVWNLAKKPFHAFMKYSRKMADYDYRDMVISKDKKPETAHFAETPLGGICIAIICLLGLIVIFWIGSLL